MTFIRCSQNHDGVLSFGSLVRSFLGVILILFLFFVLFRVLFKYIVNMYKLYRGASQVFNHYFCNYEVNVINQIRSV